MHQVRFSVRSLDQIRVTGALQFEIRTLARSQYVPVRVELVGPGQFTRSRHRHRMSPTGAALRSQQVVVAVSLVEMRSLGEPQRRALEYELNRPDQPLLCRRVLLQYDPRKTVVSRA